LRKQGYCTYPNPNYDRIREFYTILATSITNPIKTLLELANDFIGSIIINYSAYVYNNPTLIPTINGYYYSMFRLLAQLLINIIQRTPRFRDDTRELSRKLHTFFKTNMIRLSDSGDDHAKLIEWYYDVICLVNSQYCASKLKVFIRHFEPYIIDTCNMNYAKRTGNINSCRNKRSLKRAGILHHKILKTH
jgi:hypothetical protein